MHRTAIATLFVLLVSGALLAPPSLAQEGRTRDDVLTSAFRDVGEVASGSVVRVVSAGDVIGHAVVMDDGMAVTSERNVRGIRRFTLVTADGEQLAGRLRGWDGWLDVALIEFDGDVPPIRRDGDVEVGEWVLTVGAQGVPLGAGVVSAVDRDVSETRKNPGIGLHFMSPGHRTPMRAYEGVIQHDTPLEEGEMGTPLVDVDGRMVALNVARPYRSTSFAVPVEAIVAALPDLAEGKRTAAPRDIQGEVPPMLAPFEDLKDFLGDPEKIRRQFDESMGDDLSQLFEGLNDLLESLRRGMQGEPPPPGSSRREVEVAPARPGFLGLKGETVPRRGVRVTFVRPGAPADEAGIRAGDVLTHLNGNRIRKFDDFRSQVGLVPAGRQVRLRYQRLDEGSGEWVDGSVDVTLAERDDTF